MTTLLGCRNPDCTLLQGGRCAREASLPGPPRSHCPDLIRATAPAETTPSEASPTPLEAGAVSQEPPTGVPSPPNTRTLAFQTLASQTMATQTLASQTLASSTVPESNRLETHSVRRRTDASSPPTRPAPWRGRHLAQQEVEQLLARSPARVFGILGPYNAGKTCLLTSFFLQLANGQYGDFPYRFASSRSLHALLELSERAAGWRGESEAEIVDHTPRGEAVAFLHLGLCPAQQTDLRHLDVLFSDLPGEWSSEWTDIIEGETARRLAFLQRCDGLCVVLDAHQALESAKVDAQTSRLIRRLVDQNKQLPRPQALALVLSKLDRVLEQVTPPPPDARLEREAWGPLGRKLARTWAAIKEAQAQHMPVGVFPVSAFPHPLSEGQPVGVVEPFQFLMRHADPREPWTPHRPPALQPPFDRPFLAMRRCEEIS